MRLESWYERVVKKLEKADAQDKADAELFEMICTNLNNHHSNRDGEQLVREPDRATKLYKGAPVFAFHVKNGAIALEPTGQTTEQFTDCEKAVDRMADLMVGPLRDPLWSKAANAA